MKVLDNEQLLMVSGGLKNPFSPSAERLGYMTGKLIGKKSKESVKKIIDIPNGIIKLSQNV